MRERHFRDFRRKVRHKVRIPLKRDIMGRRRALPSEIERVIRPKDIDFITGERLHQPTEQDILDKND